MRAASLNSLLNGSLDSSGEILGESVGGGPDFSACSLAPTLLSNPVVQPERRG
jgi:hypothetical protein